MDSSIARKSGWRGRSRDYDRGRSGQSHPGRGTESRLPTTISVTPGRGQNAPSQQQPRPTHFLALPLCYHPALRTKISEFQTALLQARPPIAGLDKSIVIDPWRLHFTLGVMSLEPDPGLIAQASSDLSLTPTPPHKTVASALALLRSLQPQLSSLLRSPTGENKDSGLQVTLSEMDILKPERGGMGPGEVGAGVLFVGPAPSSPPSSLSGGNSMGGDGGRLLRVCDLVHQAFKDAGYITEKRPLKLHCTILNTSHRKRRGIPFSYTGVLHSGTCRLLATVPECIEGSSLNVQSEAATAATPSTATRPPIRPTLLASGSAPAVTQSDQQPRSPQGQGQRHAAHRMAPLKVDLGTWAVGGIELWVMGSHGPNNAYVSCGGVSLR